MARPKGSKDKTKRKQRIVKDKVDIEYADTGCHISPKCLECKRGRCIYG